MNPKELSELKRRLNPDRRNPTVIRGLYVGGDGHVISSFSQPVFHLPAEENEKYMAIFKRVLSGTAGQNLRDIDFSTQQVTDGAEHKLLMELRDSALLNEDAVQRFFDKAIAYIQTLSSAQVQSVEENQAAGNYLVLLMHDGYDVPYRDQNGEADAEQSTNVFSYFLCALCPVKQTKPALSYYAAENEFHSRISDWVVGAPDMGFLFPAFEERSANLYRALFYTRDTKDMHDAFIAGVFGTELPMPAGMQMETFQAILNETLAEECSLPVVKTVHETVRGMIEERKADKTAEPLAISKRDVKNMLEECGVTGERVQAFEQKYASTFGEYAEIPAVNVAPVKQFMLTTPSVSIKVDPERSDLIETRVIDGKHYILVLADGDVEVNGVNVYFEGE